MITINISGVDNESGWSMNSNDPNQIIEFMKTYDHEGSSVRLDIVIHNGGPIYKVLKALKDNNISLG